MNAYSLLVEKLTDDFGVDPARIHPEATLTDLGLDSLSLVEFIFDVEDELGVELEPDEAEFTTLGEAAALADRLMAEKEG